MRWQPAALLPFLLLAGCAGGPPKPGPEALDELNWAPANAKAVGRASDPRDPFEGANRAMWAVNYDLLELHVARPVVHAYARHVPVPLQQGIGNFVDNFDEPSSMVNHLLTGDLGGAGTNLGRFTLNSTVGLLGFVDVASRLGLSPRKLEMTTVLGRMHIGDGAYVMVPVYGPTTTRNLVGDTIDTLYFPYALLTLPLKAVHWALDGLGTRAGLIEQERLVDNALDPYGLTKDFYLQHGQAKVEGQVTKPGEVAPAGQKEEEALGDYMDEIDE